MECGKVVSLEVNLVESRDFFWNMYAKRRKPENPHAPIPDTYLGFRFTRSANYTSKFTCTAPNIFYGPAKLSSARVSKKARAVCACIIIGGLPIVRYCNFQLHYAATYATRQHAGAKSARRDAAVSPGFCNLAAKSLARAAGNPRIRFEYRRPVYGKQEGSLPTEIRVFKSANSHLDNSCGQHCRPPRTGEFELFGLPPSGDLGSWRESLDRESLEAPRSRTHSGSLLFPSFLFNSSRERAVLSSRRNSTACHSAMGPGAAYFDGTEFAIARESGRQWPASTARDQATRLASPQHCTVKGQARPNARTIARNAAEIHFSGGSK